MRAATLIIVAIQLVATCGAYQYPIQNNLPIRNRRLTNEQNQRDEHQSRQTSSVPLMRRIDADDTERHHIHQLHQVVDTVTQLLNEEDENIKPKQPVTTSVNDYQPPYEAPELLSESAIRHAIEVLEKVQAQRDKLNDELRSKSAISTDGFEHAARHPDTAPQASALQSRHDTLEGLLEELTEGISDTQLGNDESDSDRTFVSDKSRTSASPYSSEMLSSTNAPSTTSTTAKVTPSSITSTTSAPMQGSQSGLPKNDSPRQDQQSLFIGQLDSLASDLGDALTSDFYAFHEEATSSPVRTEQRQLNGHTPNQNGFPVKSTNDANKDSSAQNDLESAAQTRNSIAQRGNLQPPSFQSNTVRFDFSQPIGSSFPQIQPLGQETLSRSMRQEPDSITSAPNPSSTSTPQQNDFWRPSIDNSDLPNFNNGDLNQQYFRARDQTPNLGALPAPRFQNLNRDFSQSNPLDNQPRHIHYTGHSLIASSDFSPQEHPQTDIRPSTQAPIISVLSGRDSSNGGSVSWNPPAPIGPPKSDVSQSQPVFNQQFPQPDHLDNSDKSKQFFPNSRANTPQFKFPSVVSSESPRVEHRPKPSVERDTPEHVSSSSEFRFPESTSTQWTPSISPNAHSSTDRSVADSSPRSSFKSFPDNSRFNSNGDFQSPGSVFPPSQSDHYGITPSPQITTSTQASTSHSSPTPTGTSNSTKKDDMVIYYYYYYDDNKNATVVAKNISSNQNGASLPLDTSIEGDGGIEDTPYMDDPAPGIPVHPTSTTSTTTTASTTTVNLPVKDDHRSKLASSPIQAQPFVDIRTQKFASTERSIDNYGSSFASSRLPDSRRNPSNERTTSIPRLNHETPASPSTSSYPSSTSTSAQSKFNDINNNGQFRSTESSISTSTRGAELADQRTFVSQTAPNIKSQQDLINNVLSGKFQTSKQTSAPRQTASSTTLSAPPSGRSPMSNASRYGTNSNAVIDPLGLDPSVPASLSQPQQGAVVGHHNRIQTQTSTPLTNRKSTPTPHVATNIESSSTQKTLLASSRAGAQDSLPTRIANQQARLPSSSTTSAHSSHQPSSQSSHRQTSNQASPSRQIYPEVEQPAISIERNPSERRQPHKASHQSNRITNTETAVSNSAEFNRVNSNLDSTSDAPEPEVVRTHPSVSSSSPHTHSPSRIQSSTSPATSSVNVHIERLTSTPPSSTQPTITTSVSRSFTAPQTQTTTSVSPPTITSTTVTSSITQSVSQSVSSSPVTTTTTNVPIQEVSSTTESSDASIASTRKKFGNRTNRFQTRINSLSSSNLRSTTSTTTTPAPSFTSSTRRPSPSPTRKSSKQLFAGRRRLGSTQTPSESSVTPGENSSESTESPEPSSTATRNRFGNSFSSSRSRTTPASNDSISSSTSQRSSGFGNQRTNPKSRLPFMKATKPESSLSNEETTNSTIELNSGKLESLDKAPENMVDKVTTEKIVSSTEVMNATMADTRPKSIDELGAGERKEIPTMNSLEPTSTQPSSSTSSGDQTSRNKQRVRPLFASRQRNSNLFGNRRNNTVSAA